MDMKRTSACRRAAVSLLVFAALLLSAARVCALPAQAASRRSATPSTVRVAYYYDGDYLYKTSDGAYSGYDVEYLYEVAKYANWKFEFVDFNSFDDALAALDAGTVDILPAFFYSGERAQKYLFSSDDMGTIYVTLIVPTSDTKHAYKDYDSFQGMKVGILSGSLDGEDFRRWAAEKNLNVSITEMATDDELFAALDSGGLDAVAITYLGASSTYRVVAEFDPMKMYFAMPKKDTALMNELNSALEQITIINPAFKTNLYNKYWLVNQTQTPVFTQEEKDYIASSGTITVALQKDNAPFSYVSARGEMTGAVPDLFKRISKLSGLRFTFTAEDTQADAVSAVASGRAEIAGKVTNSAVGAAAKGLRLTNAYMELAVTQLARRGTAEPRTVAVPAAIASVYQEHPFNTDTPRQVTYYDTTRDCFSALRQGKVDAAFLDTVSTNYLMNTNRASDYTITALNGCSYHLAAAMSEMGNGTLYGILNKCIRYTSAATMNELVVKYSVIGNESLTDFIDRIPPLYLIVFFAILSAAVIFLIVLVLTLRRRSGEEKLLAEQTAALHAAERAGAEKNEFLGNVSHDMRTPLNGILGYTDLALQADDPAAIHDYLGKIRVSGRLLLDLVNDTLTISKIENRKFELHPTVVDYAELVDNVVTPIRTAADAKGIRFLVDTGRAYSGYVRVDRLAWQKIFLNLLTNAVKFTPPEGTVEFRLEDRTATDGSHSTRAVVRDTGVGMDESFLPKMFEPFAQEQPTGAGSSGTGLGLSIVHHFVDTMGGTIEVQSHKGAGSVFTVTLPLEPVPDYVPEAAKTFSAADFAGRSILLCEDNEMNAEIARSILEAKKMCVVWAANGREGAERFASSEPGEFDAVLMDIRMPVMNGYDAARAIRAQDRADAKTVPIIALSADAYDEDVQRASGAGMNAHVAKPIDPQLLYAALSKVMHAEK